MIQWTCCAGDTRSSIRRWKCEGLKLRRLNTFHKESVSQVGNPDLFSWDHWFLMRNYTCHTWIFRRPWYLIWASLVAQLVKNPPAWDLRSIPRLGRSPGEGKGYPLQYSCLENCMNCIVHGVAKSRTRLSDFHFSLQWTFSQVLVWLRQNVAILIF